MQQNLEREKEGRHILSKLQNPGAASMDENTHLFFRSEKASSEAILPNAATLSATVCNEATRTLEDCWSKAILQGQYTNRRNILTLQNFIEYRGGDKQTKINVN